MLSRRVAALLALLLPALLAALPLPLQAEDELTLGVFPRRSAKVTTTLFQPLADHLAGALGRPVRLIASKDFKAFWKAVERYR